MNLITATDFFQRVETKLFFVTKASARAILQGEKVMRMKQALIVTLVVAK